MCCSVLSSRVTRSWIDERAVPTESLASSGTAHRSRASGSATTRCDPGWAAGASSAAAEDEHADGGGRQRCAVRIARLSGLESVWSRAAIARAARASASTAAAASPGSPSLIAAARAAPSMRARSAAHCAAPRGERPWSCSDTMPGREKRLTASLYRDSACRMRYTTRVSGRSTQTASGVVAAGGAACSRSGAAAGGTVCSRSGAAAGGVVWSKLLDVGAGGVACSRFGAIAGGTTASRTSSDAGGVAGSKGGTSSAVAAILVTRPARNRIGKKSRPSRP